MTTNHGSSVVNDSNCITVGENGPMLINDNWFLEKMAHFNRERIPERTAFCKGVGAHGYFEAAEPMGDYTTARFLGKRGVKTPVFVRFSMMFGEKGTPDTSRDARGMEVKFYTDEGNMNVLSTSFPVFPIRDTMSYPDLIHSRKAAPHTGLVEMERFFDFYAAMPEMTNWMVRYYSDQGTRRSYRKITYYGLGAYLFRNAGMERFHVRFVFLPVLGDEMVDGDEARRLAALEPDVAGKDFYRTLYRDETIEFYVGVQIRKAAGRYAGAYQEGEGLDGTKVWNEEEYPYYRIGRLVLNRPPQSYFAEVEQSAFPLSQVVPGIYLSTDRLLQGMAFTSADESRYRLGNNYMQLPVNSPRVPVVNNQCGGAMRYYATRERINYTPNILARNEPREGLGYHNADPDYVAGYVHRIPVRSEDDFGQAAAFYHQLGEREQINMVGNITRDMTGMDAGLEEVVRSHLECVGVRY